MNPQTAILYNSPALHALQRKQLVSLCKRYRIKASGKNIDLISKLQAFGEQLPKDARIDPQFPLDSYVEDNCPAPATSSPVKPPRPSEPWSVLDGESAAADAEDVMVVDDDTIKGRMGWKSAENGGSELGEFGMPRSISATSLSRSTSKKLKSFLSGSLSRKAVGSIKTSKSAREGLNADTFFDTATCSLAPQSPEPGVARAMRPSIAGEEPTIRMLRASPSASESLYPELPSMQVKRLAPAKAEEQIPGGFPAVSSDSGSAANALEPPRSPAPFVFGSPMPSRQAFNFRSPHAATPALNFSSLAGSSGAPPAPPQKPRDMRAVMEEEMRELMAKKGVLDLPPPEPVENLFSREVLDSLGGKKVVKKRRFDDIHEKEFSKMPSILDHPSARRIGASTKSIKPKIAGVRLSSTATPRRPKQNKPAVATSVATPATGSRRVSALPKSAAGRILPTIRPPLSTARSQPPYSEASEGGRVTKKVKTDPPHPGTIALPPPKPAATLSQTLPESVNVITALPKPKSSRFGFLAQGMESVKTFASGLAKSNAGPSLNLTVSSMSRSTSTPAVHRLSYKVTSAASVPTAFPQTSFAPARFGFGQKEEKGTATAGMTRSESFSTRPGSTLLAPTVSSLARQAASNAVIKPSAAKKPPNLPARSSMASTRLPQPVVTAQANGKLFRAADDSKAGHPSNALTPRSVVAATRPLAVSRPSISNPPASSKTPVKRGPQFKARVASKLLSQRTAAASGSGVRRPSLAGGSRTPGKQRSSVSASLIQKQAATPSGLHVRAGAIAARKKARESVPTTSAASAARRHSLVEGLKSRGRTSELIRSKPSMMHTPKKIIPKAPTTPFFPTVPLGGIAE